MGVGATANVLVVVVDDLRIGLPLDVVGEVLRMVEVNELPGAPTVVAGVVDLRGTVVAVLDLRRRFGRSPRTPRLEDRLVSVAFSEGVVLAWVDAVHGVQSLDPATIEPLRAGLGATPHLSGVSRTTSGLLYLHDPVAFFSDREAAQLDDAFMSMSAGPASGSHE